MFQICQFSPLKNQFTQTKTSSYTKQKTVANNYIDRDVEEQKNDIRPVSEGSQFCALCDEYNIALNLNVKTYRNVTCKIFD